MNIKIRGMNEVIAALTGGRDDLQAEINATISANARKTRDRVEQLTPKNTGVTAASWFVREGYQTTSEYGRAYTAIIDHPYNRLGAKAVVATTIGGKLVYSTQVVNDGKFNLLEALEYGTRSHTIPALVPVNKQALAFSYKGNDVVVKSTKAHQHPGTRAYAMVRTAAAEAERDAVESTNALVERIVKKVA